MFTPCLDHNYHHVCHHINTTFISYPNHIQTISEPYSTPCPHHVVTMLSSHLRSYLSLYYDNIITIFITIFITMFITIFITIFITLFIIILSPCLSSYYDDIITIFITILSPKSTADVQGYTFYEE